MAAQDGVGWPEEPMRFSLASAGDDSRLVTGGLGWPARRESGRRGERDGRGPARASEREEPSAAVIQAPAATVSAAAVSRETSHSGPVAGGSAAREELPGSGAVSTREGPASRVSERVGTPEHGHGVSGEDWGVPQDISGGAGAGPGSQAASVL